MPEEIDRPKCPKCGNIELYESPTGYHCGNDNCDGYMTYDEAIQAAYLAGLEAAREAIRPINDAEELSKDLEGPWERLRVVIEAAKKEIESNG